MTVEIGVIKMHIVTIEGVPYDWFKQLQEIHAHVFDGANLPLEKLESKEGLVCLLAVENEDIIGFKIGYTHPDGIFYSWLGGVHEKKRGQGIASQLMRWQHEHLQALGFNFFQQKSPTSIGGEMNVDLSYFSADVQTPAERS